MNTKFVLVLILLGMFVSCVPHRKFEDLQKEADTTSSQLRDCKKELEDSRSGTSGRLDEIKDLRKQVRELQNDTTIRGERYRSIQRLNREMERLCEQIRKQNELLVSSATTDKKNITEELTTTQAALNKREQELIRKEKELMLLTSNLKVNEAKNAQLLADLQEREGIVNQLQGTIQARETKVKKLENDLAARENRVIELEKAISAQREQATDLRNKLNAALLSYNSSELSVEQRDGKVYVSLSQDLLFASGSKTMDSKGKAAIRSLAGVLNKNLDSEITIEGHTDDVGESASNWNLSVMRATSVVSELVANSVDPSRIIASGRGEHHPVAPNTLANGKAKNRRTEIILSPKLDRLYQIINY